MGDATIVISGMGAVSSLGVGCERLWDAVERGRDGIRAVRRFSTEPYRVHIGGLVPGHDGPVDEGDDAAMHALGLRFGSLAAREAMSAAHVDDAIAPERIGIVLGTSPVGTNPIVHALAEQLAETLGIGGPRITISTACASSTNALGLGRDLLRAEDCDLVLAGGVDVLTDVLFAGFHALGALSENKCAPFSGAIGTTLGEGAGFLVLERRADAAARGAPELATLLGYGLSSDAFHETSPDPNGAGVAHAIRSALADAGRSPEQIGYANLHGTGTAANDPAEWRGYRRVFGDRADAMPVSSTKSFLGHAQGAAGVLELIVTLSAMQRGVVPPTLHLAEPRRGAPPDPVAADAPRPHEFDTAVKTSAAFGGANAAVVISRRSAEAPTDPRRPVHLLGAAAIGLDEARGSVPPIEEILPCVDPRGMDASARLLTTAGALALRDGRVEIRGALRERTGLIAAVTRPPAESDAEFHRSVDTRGLARLSAGAFARLVLVAPAGSCCRQLSLKGPLSTLTIGPGSELLALAYAAELLAGRTDADRMLAGGVYEPSSDSELRPGAAAVLLGAADATRDAIRVAGWCIGAPGNGAEVSRRALRRSGRQSAATFSPGRREASAEGAGWVAVCVEATTALREGAVETVLLCCDVGRSASVAVVLTRGRDG